MGLSSKQVCDGRLDWTQNMLLQNGGLDPLDPPKLLQSRPLQQQPLKCPRCNSTNTKFCYYNNYNRSQPRHFCKSCRRHWTEGGTLRNVPVGGGRKNKRPKRTSNTSDTHKNTNNTSNTSNIQQQEQQVMLYPSTDQGNISQIRGPFLPYGASSNSSNNSLGRASFPLVSQISPLADMGSYHTDLSSSSEQSYIYNSSVNSFMKNEILEMGHENSLLTLDDLMVLPTADTAMGNYQDPDNYWNWDELGL